MCIYMPKSSQCGIIVQSYCTSKKGAIFCFTVYVLLRLICETLTRLEQSFDIPLKTAWSLYS